MFRYPYGKPQDIDVVCVQPNEIAQNAVEPIFLASLRRLARNMGSTAFARYMGSTAF